MGKKPAQANEVLSAATAPIIPLVPPTEIYPALDARLKAWIGPDAPYTVAAKRVAELRSELRLAEGVCEFEARKLASVLGAVASPEVERAMAAKWYDQDLRQLLLNYVDQAELRKLITGGATDLGIRNLLLDVADRLGDKDGSGDDPFAEVMVYGGLVLKPPVDQWDAIELYHAEKWKAGQRSYKDSIVGEDADDDDDLLAQIRRVLEIPTPEEAAVAKKAAKAAEKSKPAPKPKPAAAKPVPSSPAAIKRAAAKTAEVENLAKKSKPAGGAVTNVKLLAQGNGQFTFSFRKAGHTRYEKVTASSLENAINLAATKIGVDADQIQVPAGMSQPKPATKKPAAKKSSPAHESNKVASGGLPPRDARMGQKTGNPYVYCDDEGTWRLVDGTGKSYQLKATDLREARAEAVEQHGMPDGGVGIPKCSDFGLFRPMGKGTFLVSYYNGDNDSIEETGLEAAAWGAAVKEAAALFYLEPDAFEEIVKDDKVRDAAHNTPAPSDLLSEAEKAALTAPLPSVDAATNAEATDAPAAILVPLATVFKGDDGHYRVRGEGLDEPVKLDATIPLAARIEAAEYLDIDVDDVAIADDEAAAA
jgi:hypothetical protein